MPMSVPCLVLDKVRQVLVSEVLNVYLAKIISRLAKLFQVLINGVSINSMYSRLSRNLTASGSCTILVTVSSTTVKG